MFTWPNRVTLLRILLLPLIIIGVLHAQEERWLQVLVPCLFGLSALGDSLDGFLARRLGQHSAIGKLLDPLADKLTMSSTSILLSIPALTEGWIAYPIPPTVVVLLLARDLLIFLGYLVFYLHLGIEKASPSRIGKATTAAQMTLVVMTLLSGAVPRSMVESPAILGLFWALWAATAALTVVSGLHYFWRATRPAG